MASDLISRESLLEAMNERYNELEKESYYSPYENRKCYKSVVNSLSSGFYEVDELVNQQPTVDAVEVVHGKWDVNFEGDNIVYCNQCYIPQCMETPYCPNCGSKMDGGDK